MKRSARLVWTLLLVSSTGPIGCATTAPRCLVGDAGRATGSWRYLGGTDSSTRSFPAHDLGRPDGVELRREGVLVAHYLPPGENARSRRPYREVAVGDVTGTWTAGRYCLGSLFIPRTHVSTDPELPDTVDIIVRGDRLVIVGADSGMTDAEYVRGVSQGDRAAD